MPRYTDRDVQNLISDIRHLINQPEVRHIAPLSCSKMDRRLLSFAPDPWEKLAQHLFDRTDTTYIPNSPATKLIAKDVIAKAVELGLVTKVGAE